MTSSQKELKRIAKDLQARCEASVVDVDEHILIKPIYPSTWVAVEVASRYFEAITGLHATVNGETIKLEF